MARQAFPDSRSLADPLLSRFAPRAGLVALCQTFGRGSHRGWARLCADRTIPRGQHRCCFYVWRWRHIAPAHEGPRNESSNKAHEPTSGRSTHYGVGHLIRVFRDIGHIFSSPYPFIGGSVS